MDQVKLRNVIAQRLVDGENPADVRAQLVRRLSAEEADRLIEAARARISAEGSSPAFLHDMAEARARKVAGNAKIPLHEHRLRFTAGFFGAIGLLALFGGLTRAPVDTSMVIAGLMFAVPAARLWTSDGRIAAGFLVVLCGFGLLVALVFTASIVGREGLGVLAMVVPWVFFVAISIRALLVVNARRKHARPS